MKRTCVLIERGVVAPHVGRRVNAGVAAYGDETADDGWHKVKIVDRHPRNPHNENALAVNEHPRAWHKSTTVTYAKRD